MGNFFKLFLKGVVVTLLLPLILVVWVLYGVYCLGLFVVMFVKGVIEFFQGKEPSGEMIEDIESKRTILEQEQADAHAREVVNMMYQNAMAQQQAYNPPVNAQPAPAPAPIPTYGADIFNEQPSHSEEPEQSNELVNNEEQNEVSNDDSNLG